MKNILQNFVFPKRDTFQTSALKVRWIEGNAKLAENQGFPMEMGDLVAFNTYFNGFSAAKWRKITSVSEIGLGLSGTGVVIVRVFQTSIKYGDFLIFEEEVSLDDSFDQIIEELDQFETTSLFATLEPVTDAKLVEAHWYTPQSPINDVALAAVITTFGREAAAIKAFEKFEKEILREMDGSHLFLIDNGQSLDLKDSETATVIPNENLGGAGGFTRGLLEAIDQKRFSHVLFMDDDADCEPEAVHRTVALLKYINKERCAVSGALLLENAPTVQHENSAKFDGNGEARSLIHTFGHGADLSHWPECIHNDVRDAGNYGAWWFFAFPIKDVRKLPFPFFVRGDDIEFSLENGFNIVTLNGIATHSSDFASKNTPGPEYLGERSLLALISMHGGQKTLSDYAKRLSQKAEKLIRNWDYGRAAALIFALEDVPQGPKFFGDNPNCIFRFKDISAFANRRPATIEELQSAKKGKKINFGDKVRQKFSDHSSKASLHGSAIVSPLSGQTRNIHGGGNSVKIKFDYDTMYAFEFDFKKETDLRKRLKEVKMHWAKNVQTIFQDYQNNAPNFKKPDYWRPTLKMDD